MVGKVMPKGKKSRSAANSRASLLLGLMGQGDKEELTEELSAIRQDLSEQDEEHVRRAEALKDSIAAYEKASRSSTKALGQVLEGIVQVQSEETVMMERVHAEIRKTRQDIAEIKQGLTYLGSHVATSKDMALMEELLRLLTANHLIDRV
jgi:hypothetical protein